LNKKTLGVFIERLIFNHVVPTTNDKIWEYIIQVLRETNLLASCYYRLKAENKIEELPFFALKHMKSAVTYSERQAKQVQFECKIIDEILSSVGITPLFLKGAGYTLRKSRNSLGRVYSDIDVLVDKSEIDAAEQSLSDNGWRSKPVSIYDDKYYREWSHEIPPMLNLQRGTIIDLHHNIVLPISGKNPPLKILTNDPCETEESGRVLSVVSAIIHSSVHLVINEDVSKGYRDLLDISTLIEDNESTAFWEELYSKSTTLGFIAEVYVCLILCQKIAKTEVPGCILEKFALEVGTPFNNWFINNVYYLAIQPHSELIQTFKHKLAVFIVMILGHFKKMPLKVLIPHTIHKLYIASVERLLGKYHFDKSKK